MTADAQFLAWAAPAAAGLAFGGFAWLFADAFSDATGAYTEQMGEETSRAFEDVFLFVPARKIARLGRLGALAAFFLFFIPLFSFTNLLSTVCGIALGAAAGAFAFTLPGKYVAFLKERRRLKFNAQLPEALGTMSNALRAGFSINQAFESVVGTGDKPISQEFSVFMQQMRVGMSFEKALDSLTARVGSDDLLLVTTAIDIARKTGGNLTEIFDRISETIRGRMRIENRVRTLTAQGRLQGLVVSIMPFGLGVAMTALKPKMMIPFLLSPKGIACVAVVVALVTVGWMIIRKIIRIDV